MADRGRGIGGREVGFTRNATQRRTGSALAAAALACAGLTLTAVGCAQRGVGADVVDGAVAPNIVLIVADDLGYHDLAAYGQELIETPHLDRLVSGGIRFTAFYAGSPVCAPSRSVLLTGQHAGHTKVRANYARAGGLRRPPGSTARPGHPRIGLGEDDVTIGDVMRQAGYVTGYMGKWHLSGYDKNNLPIHRGFDEYRGSGLAGPGTRRRDKEFVGDSVVPTSAELHSDYDDDNKTRNAIEFIERNHRNRFFLVLSLSAPHKPFDIPSPGDYADRPWSEMAKNYAAMVTRLDEHVGTVVDALEEAGIRENTLVIFVSDNGGEHRNGGGSMPDHSAEDWVEWTRLFRSNHPLRGGKADLYEGGIRVPAILSWPARLGSAHVNTDAWHFVDLMPTLAALGGVEGPPDVDGIDMLPVLLKRREYPEDRYLYWEFDHESFAQSVRWREWKLIRWTTYRKRIYGAPEASDDRRSRVYPLLELYNLAEDIEERHNVVERHPQVVATMIDLLDEARTESPHWPLTDEEREGLRRSVVPSR